MLSICTPTYNRAYTLERLYKSLVAQTDGNFEWIIINDGSTDNTRELVHRFKEDNLINIIYCEQENFGKHIALNKAYKLAKFEHVLCLDSDDWLLEEAVETLNNDYKKYLSNSSKIAGLIYLDIYENNKVVGSELANKKVVNWINLRHKENMIGDKCYTFKKSVLKKYPFVSFKDNRHMPPTYQFYLISKEYDMLTINKPLKVVEYLADGISKNIRSKYYSSAENYAYYRKVIHDLLPDYKSQIKNLLLYNISYYSSNKNSQLKFTDIKTSFLSKILLPLSYLLSIYYKGCKI